MSDLLKCDNCEEYGNRRMFRNAPEGWFYLEAPTESDIIIVAVCSLKCGEALWKPARKKGGFKLKAIDDETKECVVVRAPTMVVAMARWLPGPGPRVTCEHSR